MPESRVFPNFFRRAMEGLARSDTRTPSPREQRKFNDDYYKGEQLRDPGPGRRQPRQDAKGQRRDEEEGVQPIQDAAVAREQMPEVLDVRVALEHRRREVSNKGYGRDARAVDEA